MNPDTILDAPDTPLHQQLLASAEQVQQAIDTMAEKVIEQYSGQNPLFVCLLRGGAPFATDLMKAVARHNPHFHPELDYMTISTYGDERTDNPPQLVMDVAPRTTVEGRHVILLDDTLDKGVTAAFAEQHLKRTKGAATVDLLVLVQKKLERTAYASATMYCFESDGPAWLTGMGLDDTRIAPEANRWSNFVAIANSDE